MWSEVYKDIHIIFIPLKSDIMHHIRTDMERFIDRQNELN